MEDEDRAELREKTRVMTEGEEHAVYEIPKDQVSEYFTYGKPQEAIAEMLGGILAREHWDITEEEAYDQNVSSLHREHPDFFEVVVYQGADAPEDESSFVDS
jgi:hypothetical protein